jgi:hypothetical protein
MDIVYSKTQTRKKIIFLGLCILESFLFEFFLGTAQSYESLQESKRYGEFRL